jgi:putative hydrolase of the HAD superfamily
MIKAIFFDAAGTLFHLPKGVGHHYALVAREMGFELDAALLERAFVVAWKQMPARAAGGQPRADDDRGWWRDLVDRVIDQAGVGEDFDRAVFFESAYRHFTGTGVWELYPETIEVLKALAPRFSLSVASNFDGRLRQILRELDLADFFQHIFLSSELGADKPDPLFFRRVLELSGFAPNESLHAGDDPERDWEAAARAGLQTFRLDRPRNSLRDLLTFV